MNEKTVAIVGAGHAGGRVAQHLIERGYTGRIVLIGEEPHAPYERPALSKELLVGSKTTEDLMLQEPVFWIENPNLARVHARVVELDPRTKSLQLSDGQTVAFDDLVLATGGAPRRLKIPGGNLPGLHYLRTIDDCLQLRSALQGARRMVIIGAGVIGMEAAASATRLGLQVDVVEAGSRIMSRCIPEPVSEWLAEQHHNAGVRLHLNAGVSSIEGKPEGFQVNAKDAAGHSIYLAADVVLIAVGIECETDFADQAGVLVDNGVVVDEFCRSVNTPWCYAVGDVARTFVPRLDNHVRQETWRNAENQAMAVAEFILGRAEPYHETQWMWTDQFEHNIQVVGVPHIDDEVIVRGDLQDGRATLVHLRDKRVVGGVLINQAKDRRPLEALVERAGEPNRAQLADTSISLKVVAA